MQKLITILLLSFSLASQAQYVYIAICPNKALAGHDPFWNNWMVRGQRNDSSQFFTDIAGDTTKIRAIVDDIGADFDNGPGYKKGQKFLPDSVLRQGIYDTKAFPMTFLVDTGYTYTVSFICSRDIVYQKNQFTKISYGALSLTVLTDTNTTRMTTFPNLSSSTGKLAFTIQPVTGAYAYINAVIITGVPKVPLVSVKVWVDSSRIRPPTSIVHVRPSMSDGSPSAWMVEQTAQGPSKAVILPYDSASFILAGLQPGTYVFNVKSSLDKYGNFDSAFVVIDVGPFPATVPPASNCPAPSRCIPSSVFMIVPPSAGTGVTGMIGTMVNGQWQIKYSYGKP